MVAPSIVALCMCLFLTGKTFELIAPSFEMKHYILTMYDSVPLLEFLEHGSL